MILTDDEVSSIVQSDGCDIVYHEESEECSTCRGIIRATERAVLEKLREPTRAMLMAGDAVMSAGLHTDAHCPTVAGVWEAMIDAATKAD